MFKKIFFVVLMLNLLSVSSANAAALRSGLYVGMTGGASMMRAKIKEKMEHGTSFVSTLALGGRFGSVRGALEFMMNTKVDYKGNNEKISYEANSLSFQTYYDVPVRSMFRPFFNLGIGVAGTDIKGEPDINESSSKFAWNVGAGFTLAVSRATSLDLGYRYIRFAKDEYKDGNGNKIPFEAEAHQVYAGYRYVF